MLKSHLLSKMYLQQYCGGLTQLNKQTDISESPKKGRLKIILILGSCLTILCLDKSKKNGDSKAQNSSRKDTGSLLDSPLDLSTRHLDSRQTQDVSTKDRLYPQHFQFASLQQMLLQSNMTPNTSNSTPPKAPVSKADKSPECPAPSVAPPSCSPTSPCSPPAASDGKDLSYVCPICGQMFGLHDRLAKHMASRHKSKAVDSSSKVE